MADRNKRTERLLALPIGLIGIDIAFQKVASDPLNPVKFWVLAVLGIWAVSDLVAETSWFANLKSNSVLKTFSSILGIFTIVYLAAFIATPVKSIGLIGDTGRNIGFLNYLFLVLVSIYSALRINLNNLKNIYWTVIVLNLALTTYGLLQHFKIDFLKWNSQYNPIILVTGNPDFAASLLGLFVAFTFAAIFLDFSKTLKIWFALQIIVTEVVIYWTQARQGFVTSAIGIGLILTIVLWKRNKKVAIGFFGLEIFGGILALLGSLQIGPLTNLMFKESITDRGYNWQAAIEMVKHHPLFGVGVDRYAAYFLQYRDAKYPLLFGYNQTVTNAHNVFLQTFATAGIFAGLAYSALIIFIGFRAFFLIKNSSGKNQILLAGLVAGWLVFVAQSFISVDALVLSIWGWVLGAAIVGISSVEAGVQVASGTKPDSVKRGMIFTSLILVSLVFIVPMYRNETSTLNFSRVQNPTDPRGQQIYKDLADKTFNQFLLNPNYKEKIAESMARNNYGPEAIKYFKATIKADPRNTNSYSLLALVLENLKQPGEAIKVREELIPLDPYGAENFLALESNYLKIGNKEKAIEMRDAILKMAPGTDVAKNAEKLLTK